MGLNRIEATCLNWPVKYEDHFSSSNISLKLIGKFQTKEQDDQRFGQGVFGRQSFVSQLKQRMVYFIFYWDASAFNKSINFWFCAWVSLFCFFYFFQTLFLLVIANLIFKFHLIHFFLFRTRVSNAQHVNNK